MAPDSNIGRILFSQNPLPGDPWWRDVAVRTPRGWRRIPGSPSRSRPWPNGEWYDPLSFRTYSYLGDVGGYHHIEPRIPASFDHPFFGYLQNTKTREEGLRWIRHFLNLPPERRDTLDVSEWIDFQTGKKEKDVPPKQTTTAAPPPEPESEKSTFLEAMKDVGNRTLDDFKLGGLLGLSQAVSDEIVDYCYPLAQGAFPVGTPEPVIRKVIGVSAPILLRLMLAASPAAVPGQKYVDKALGLAITAESADGMRQAMNLFFPLLKKISELVATEAAMALLAEDPIPAKERVRA